MTELDPELLRLVRDTPPETLEHFVLQHVRIATKQSKRHKTLYVVSDLQGNEITRIPFSAWVAEGDGQTSPAKVIAQALLKTILCAACGQKLIEGEADICTLCEAKQVADLRRIVHDLG